LRSHSKLQYIANARLRHLINMSLASLPGPQGLPTSSPSIADISSHIDLLISLTLHAWPDLTYAIQNGWGGSPQLSKDKRDWLAGSISELLSSNQITHLDDLEEVLLQVMLDEFEVVVDDGSAFEVAQKIWKGRDKVLKGDFTEVEIMHRAWEEKQKKGDERIQFSHVQESEDAQETDWDEDDDEGEEEEWNGIQDGDEEMSEAPPLVEQSRKERIEPEVDEDGFTKVVGRKKR